MEPAGGDEDLGPPSAQMYDQSLHATLSSSAVRYVRLTSTPALHCASSGHSSAAGANGCRCACIGSQKAFAGDSQERFEHDCCARLLVRFDKGGVCPTCGPPSDSDLRNASPY